MIDRLLAAGAIALAAFSSSVLAAGVEAADIDAMLNAGQQKAALEKHFSCNEYPGSAYEKIATGNATWVALAQRVLPFADACYSEGIQAALGSAMRKAPRNVLPLVGRSPALAADHICIPFISDEQPVSVQRAELKKSRDAITAAKGGRLAKQKSACLRLIRSIEARIGKP